MAPPDDDTDYASPFVYPVGATNPELADKYLQQHRAEMKARQGDIDSVLGRMQMTTDTMTKLLDDTTATIKASRQGQTNLPLMAMAAGLLSNRGNFGQQLGAGFGAMVPTIQKQREDEDNMNIQLAQLAMRKSMLEQAPLEAKLRYNQALQTGDLGAVRAIEQALIRAQGSSSNQANQQGRLVQKAVQDALSEARKQVDAAMKESDVPAEERDAEVRKRFGELIKVHRAAGIPIPEGIETQIFGTPAAGTGVGIGPTKFKSYFNEPTPETRDVLKKSGLPGPPAGYVYDNVGRTEKTKTLATETANFNKESKDWDTQSAKDQDNLNKLNEMASLVDRKPKMFGPVMGMLPNWVERNTSNEAKTFDALASGLQIHSIPQGQGAISDFERRLFAGAGPSMEHTADSNRNLIHIGQEIIKRNVEQRQFFNEYWNAYKTTNGMVSAWERYVHSPQGASYAHDKNGNIVANKNRMPWREYFKKENGYAQGGPVKLGEDYD